MPTGYRRGGYRRSRYNTSKYKPRPKGRLQTARKMTGSEPTTMVDTIASGIGQVATIAKAVSGIAALINVEDKYVDTPISLSVSSASPQGTTLNGMVQGSGRNQRNGNKVLNKCLQINYRVYLDPTATSTNIVRVIILLDKKPQINTIGFNTIYTPTGDVDALIDKDNAGDRVVILKDTRHILDPGDRRMAFKKLFIKLDRLHTQFTGSASLFESGEIRLIAISDAAGTQPNTLVSGNARFCFLDN